MKSKFLKRILVLALVVLMSISTMAISMVSASAYVDPEPQPPVVNGPNVPTRPIPYEPIDNFGCCY